ncbi:MAG: ABC transporter permease, partial [Proteobacteria bacterium]
IIVTQSFAQQNGLKIDSKLKLQTALGPKIFTVRGILKPEGAARAYGGSLAIMDIDGARYMFKREGKIDRIDIVPVSEPEIPELRVRLKNLLGETFTVEEPETTGQEMRKMIASYQMMLTFFSSLALLVGLFLIYNSTAVSVAERRREIGVLRSLGATQKQILGLFVAEAATMGILGSALGLFLGRLLASQLVGQVTAGMSAQYSMPIKVTNLVFSVNQIIFTLGLGLLTSIISALIPAFQASRIPPVEALKPKGISFERDHRLSQYGVWFGLLSLVFAVIALKFELPRYWRPIEQLTQGASVLGAAFFGPFVVFGMIRLLKLVFRVRSSPMVQIARENLLRSRKRTSSNIMALMVGLFFVMLVATVRASFHETLMTWLGDVLTADLIVTSSGRVITAEVQPMDESLQSELLKIPGVKPVGEGRGISQRILQFTSAGSKYAIKAFDYLPEYTEFRTFHVTDRNREEAARELFSSTEPLIMVSENYLTKHPDVRTGGTVTLDTPSGRIPFRVIARMIDYASPQGVFYLNREVYKRYWKDSMVTSFGLALNPGADLETVRRAVDQQVGQKWGLVAVSNAEMRSMMKTALDQSFAYTRAVELAALLVALMGLLNTLLISVMERTREIGVLRAIGSTRRQIARMILVEALIQGGFGALVASAIGALIAFFYIHHGLAPSLGWQIDFHLPITTFLTTLGFGMGVAWLAGLYPAYRASKLKVVESLSYE